MTLPELPALAVAAPARPATCRALVLLALIGCGPAALAAPVAPTTTPPPKPAVAAVAFANPTPFVATYEVRLNNLPFKATARQSLVALGNNRWRLELKVESFVVDSTELSEFRWDSSRCRTIPERYRYTRDGIGSEKLLDMRFDFGKKLVTRNNGEKVTSYAITDQTEDKLGHTLGLACRIARGARGKVSTDVAWDKDLRHFDYLVASREETIVTPAGSWQALRFERQRTDDDRITTSWLSARAGWQAVQMQHSEGDGKLFQLQLMQLHQPGSKTATGNAPAR